MGTPVRVGAGNAVRNGLELTELVSVDDTIDEIGRQALAEARRAEEAEKYRKQPGPVVGPTFPPVPSK